MSANNFARPSWVEQILRQCHGVALPQFTDADFHARNLSMNKKALINLVKRSQTEYNRLGGVAERINSEIECLRAGTLTTLKQQELDRHERAEMARSEDYDEELYEYTSKEEALEELLGQHKLVVETREKVRKAEREMAEVVAQQAAARDASSTA